MLLTIQSLPAQGSNTQRCVSDQVCSLLGAASHALSNGSGFKAIGPAVGDIFAIWSLKKRRVWESIVRFVTQQSR
jgi:hypothetical protein